MYYLSVILLLVFKIPPKKEHFRRLGASIAKRGHMQLYERIIDSYDKNILIYSQKYCRNASFTGTGFSAGVINSYRKLEFNDQTLFEKIYLGYLQNNNEISLNARLRISLIYPVLSMLGYKRYNPHTYRCKFPRPYSAHLEIPGFHYGAHAYGVTLEGIKKILDKQTPIAREADNVISDMCMHESIKAFRVKERVFHQDREQFESQISDI